MTTRRMTLTLASLSLPIPVLAFTLCAPLSVQAQSPASVPVSIDVNGPRTLNVPPGFTISVYARIGGARFLATTPDGNLLVTQPNGDTNGKIFLIRPNGDQAPLVTEFATGLRRPHDMVFHKIGNTTYLYVAETNRIRRCLYFNGDLQARTLHNVVSDLPDASSPELRGAHGHALKNIAIDSNNKLYISSASVSNDDPNADFPLADLPAAGPPVVPRAAILQYNADGTAGRVFARGVRNAEGLDVLPGTNQLWLASNNSDNLKYPYNDATGWFGQVRSQYVDNHPPEYMTRVFDGANFGWPFAYANPDNGFTRMPLDPGYDHNRLWQNYPASLFTSPTRGIQAHSAPLGFSFFQKTNVPNPYQRGAVAALHGSWNRTQYTGYKVVFFPWHFTQVPSIQLDFVTGWLDSNSQTYWGRPVDTAVGPQGDIFISDDHSGTVYKMSPTGTRITSFTLINAATGQPIPGYDPILPHATINLAQTGTRLSLRANTSPATVGSVRFGFQGNMFFRTENTAPYSLTGKNGSNYNPWTPGVGNIYVTATPFSGSNGTGTAGASLTLPLQVVSTPVPTPSGNLLLNSDFEAQNYNSSEINSWIGSGDLSAEGLDSIEGGASGSARYGSHRATNRDYETYTSQDVVVPRPGLYTLRAYVKRRSPGPGVGSRTIEMGVEIYPTSTTGYQWVSTPIQYADNWTLVTLPNINVPAGATYVTVGFWSVARSGDWLAFDRVEFFKQ